MEFRVSVMRIIFPAKARLCAFFTGLILFCTNLTTNAQVDVLMNRNDIQRTGANLSETTLNTSNVNSRQFGKRWTYHVGGQVYAQPLHVTGVSLPGIGVKNIVYIADMHNDVYAFDADDPAKAATPYWSVSFGHSVPLPNPQIGYPDYPDVTAEVGIMSTPAIDKSTNTIYFVTKTQVGSLIADSLHALDLSTGKPKLGGAQGITATVPGTGDGASTVSFISHTQNQRSSLLLSGGIVYIAYASYGDWPPYHGWIFGYDASDIRQQSIVYNPNPDGQNIGIWMAGAGPSADSAGNLYVVTANGMTGTNDLGESFLKLTPDPAHHTLTLADYFTPYSQAYLDSNDDDLGSSGALLIPHSHMIVAAGKEGLIYLVDEDNMGQYHAGTDPSVDENLQEIEAFPNQLMGTPVYWADSANNPNTGLTYWWAQGDVLKAFRIDNLNRHMDPTPVAQGPASEQPQEQDGIISLSANGNTPGSAILWANYTLGTDSTFTGAGILGAYDATNLTELWNSNQAAMRDSVGTFAKFVPPTIADGKVYLATFSHTVNVYGLLVPDSAANNTLHVYPDPAHDQVTVAIGGPPSGENAELQLYNSAGALVFRQPVVLGGDQLLTILRSSAMPAGVYVVVLLAASGHRQQTRFIWTD